MTNWPQKLDAEIKYHTEQTGIAPDLLVLTTSLHPQQAQDTARGFPGVLVGEGHLLTYAGIPLAFEYNPSGRDVIPQRRGVRITGIWHDGALVEMACAPLRGSLPTPRVPGLCLTTAQAGPRALELGLINVAKHTTNMYWTPDRSHYYTFPLGFTKAHDPAIDTLIQKGGEAYLAQEHPRFIVKLCGAYAPAVGARTWEVSLYDNVGNRIVQAADQPSPGVGLLNAILAIKGA